MIISIRMQCLYADDFFSLYLHDHVVRLHGDITMNDISEKSISYWDE